VAVWAFFGCMKMPPSSRPQASATITTRIMVPRLAKKSAALRFRPPNLGGPGHARVGIRSRKK
jgi:hypothetical protein